MFTYPACSISIVTLRQPVSRHPFYAALTVWVPISRPWHGRSSSGDLTTVPSAEEGYDVSHVRKVPQRW